MDLIRRRSLLSVAPLALAGLAAATAARAQPAAIANLPPHHPPPHYPPRYAAMVAAANAEGRVIVHSNTDRTVMAPLLEDFSALYPKIAVRHVEASSGALYEGFVRNATPATASAGSAPAPAPAAEPAADMLWSSAMDLQVKLVNDGFAASYRSPESAHLAPWSMWRFEAYGVTVEPVGLAYDRRRVAADELPHTHAELAALLDADPARWRGRVATYDLQAAGLGLLFAAQDAQTSDQLWAIARAFGRVQVRELATTSAMLDAIAGGDCALAYNVLAPYALGRAAADPVIGFIYPRDYTLACSRIAFIARNAEHPNAARLWLDYLLSQRGQTVLAQRARLASVRADVPSAIPAAALQRLAPIAIGPGLMAYLDRSRRDEFLRRWRRALSVERG